MQVERETGKKLKVFRCDGGGEFFPTVWINFIKEHSIRVKFTSPNTPEQNGASECLNCTLFDSVRTCLIDSKLPLSLWAHCVSYMVYTKNRNTTSALTNQTKLLLKHATDKSPTFPACTDLDAKLFSTILARRSTPELKKSYL